MNFIIRKADKRHLDDINRLITEAKISDPIDELPGPFWFVRIDGRIIACAGLELVNNHKVAVLTYLAVKREFRHHGIGSALVQYRIGVAKRNLKVRRQSPVREITEYFVPFILNRLEFYPVFATGKIAAVPVQFCLAKDIHSAIF